MRQILMTIFISALCLSALSEEYPNLPESPLQLIEELKAFPAIYTTWEIKLNYVSEKDLPSLVKLLDSEEPCLYSVMSLSSRLPDGRSTVGREAAYLIESFWKQYYPLRLTSEDAGIPKKEEIKAWYRQWSNLKQMQNQSVHSIAGSARLE
jgi:hypothetical protein